MLPLQLTLLGLGLFGLWGGTLLTIRGAVQLADRYGLSHGFVGLAVLAIGTDLPELVVSLSGSAQHIRGIDASGVIVGSAIGSVVAQSTLVLGVAGLFGYLPIAPRMVRRDGSIFLLCIGLSLSVAIDGAVGRVEGMILLLAYAIYFTALVQAERIGGREEVKAPDGRLPPAVSITIGLVLVALAAHVVVTEGIEIASALGMSQTLLGVIFVGAGTSLPELALSVRAATERHASLSVGNVIGSNIFDLLVPIGIGALIYPLTVDAATVGFDFPALALAAVALLFFLIRKRGLQRSEAIALLAVYVGYASLRVIVG